MLKEQDTILRPLLMLADLLLVVVAFYLAYFMREGWQVFEAGPFMQLYPLQQYLNLIPLSVFLWGGCLNVCGAYEPFRGKGLFWIVLGLLRAAMLTAFLFAAFAFLMKLHYLSRSFIFVFFGLATTMLVLQRVILISSLSYFRRKGLNFRRVLLVGTGKRAQDFMRLLKEHPEWGLQIMGLVDKDEKLKGNKILGQTVLGTLEDIPGILSRRVVDEVIFVVPRSWLENLEEVIHYCETVGKRVSIATGLFTMEFSKATQVLLPGFPLLMFQSTSDKLGALWIKRALDVFIAATTLIVLSPFLLVIGALIKLDSKGPVLFKQKRSGLNGRKFTMIKFRSMEKGAEAKLKDLHDRNEMTGPAFKIKDDPRITSFGKWLRRSSIDEFPQLWNVLMGDMSIVGPRPPIPEEVQKYVPWQRRRLSMRPGLTCIWQISGRNKIRKFDQWMKMDLEYIDNWSLGSDLKIFLKTIPVVLFWIGSK